MFLAFYQNGSSGSAQLHKMATRVKNRKILNSIPATKLHRIDPLDDLHQNLLYRSASLHKMTDRAKQQQQQKTLNDISINAGPILVILHRNFPCIVLYQNRPNLALKTNNNNNKTRALQQFTLNSIFCVNCASFKQSS